MLKYTTITPIDKGWSGDGKFRATDKDGRAMMLRVSDEKKLGLRRFSYELMEKCAALGVPICRPIDFAETADGSTYTSVEWIDGRDAEETIPALPALEQYRLGLDSGRALKKIHSIPAPDDVPNWSERFNKKIDRKLKMYAECELKYENGQAFVDFIAANRHLLDDRHQTAQHGDYHIGNMMLDSDGELVIIDFDRCDWGDPWEEFNRIVWSAQASPLFASGTVDGYFGVPDGGVVPGEFWALLALYISSNTLSSLPWAIPFGESEISTMKKQAAEVLGWYDNMTKTVPNWYQPKYGLCCCGHDCTRCVTYRASIKGDAALKMRACEFYKSEMQTDIPADELVCCGGRSGRVMKLCSGCPFVRCCRDKGLSHCEDCEEFPCPTLEWYRDTYVNKCNQV